MSKKEIVVLALRISSLALVFYTLNHAAITLSGWQGDARAGLAVKLLMVLGPLVIAGFTWLFAYPLAHVFVPSITEGHEQNKIEQLDIEATAFTIVGVFLLIYAIPDTFYWLSFLYYSSSLNVDFNLLGAKFIASIFKTLSELIICFWLLFGAKGLPDLLKKVRTAGQRKRDAF